jgi:RimJ/RimL family protein N-acetyltransferase
MEFVRTRDPGVITNVLTHLRVWDNVHDDFAPPREVWRPEIHDSVWYVAAHDKGEVIGLFTVYPQNHVCWEIHIAFLPKAWGPRAKRAFGEFVTWLMAHTRCERLIASVPRTNPLAIRFAKAVGMQEYGLNMRSVKIGGQLVDQILLGLSKEE